jgi:hypothetical protein
MCIVQGPVKEPRVISKKKTLTVEAHRIGFTLGTPVICHGLKNADYLNGKIGDIRSFDDSGDALRFCVHFEDESIPPKNVKGSNLRILFELHDGKSGLRYCCC